MATEFVWIAPLFMGVIIGLIELFFVHADERGMGWLGHGLHALPVMIILIVISMNISFFAGLLNFAIDDNFWVNLIVRLLLGIIATVKVLSAAAIAGPVGEKKWHGMVIGALIAGAPYIWVFIEPLIPFA